MAKQPKDHHHQPRPSMVKSKYIGVLLVLIFLLTLGVRLYYTAQAPTFTGDQAYYTLRQVEHITKHATPIIDDPLSYGGTTTIVQPIYYYILALFSLFLPMTVVAKLLPNLFAASLVIIVYYITKDLTQDKEAALLSAFSAGFIPLFFAETTNTISVYTIIFPLFFYMVYCFYHTWEGNEGQTKKKQGNQQSYVYQFVLLFLLLTLMHSITIVFLVALTIYFILLKLEKLKREKVEKELYLFSGFLFLWTQLVLFKKALLMHGSGIIWQNIPEGIFANYFKSIPLGAILPLLGIVTVMYGIYSLYHHLFTVKHKKAFLFISLLFASGSLLWLKLIKLELALMIMGVCFSILFSELYKDTLLYMEKTRFSKYKKFVWIGFLVVLVVSAALPSMYYTSRSLDKSMSLEEHDALQWLQHNTRKNKVIVAAAQEGHFITQVAQRKNVMDTNFLLQQNAKDRFEQLKAIFEENSGARLISRLQLLEGDYLYLSRRARILHHLKDFTVLKLAKQNTCLQQVYQNKEVHIFELTCKAVERI